MATTIPYLEITDGVNSVKLMDSAATTPALVAAMNYRLSFGGWSPNIATRNQTPFGLPYNPVREELTIDVKGVTADVALAKLQVLNLLLDQAERWYNNEVVLPVFIRYQPKGSIKTTYLSDVIIGRGMGDQSTSPMISLPSDFNAVGDFYFLQKVRVVFWRRNGVWLCEDEDQALTNQTQRSIMTVTWSNAATVLSPIDIIMNTELPDPDYATNTANGILLVTHSETFIGIVSGSTLGTSTADTTNNSVSGNVGRFGPIAAGTTVDFFYSPAEPLYLCEYVAVYATIRNNSSTITFYLQVSLQSGTNPIVSSEVTIPPYSGSAAPQVVFLGVIPTRGRQPFRINIAYRSNDPVGSTETFDIDQILHFGVNRATNVLALNAFKVERGGNSVALSVLNRLLLEPQPEISYGVPALGVFETPINYSGSAYNFAGGSSTLLKTAMVLFATHGAKWQITSAANTTPKLGLTATRLKAYLVPE